MLGDVNMSEHDYAPEKKSQGVYEELVTDIT